MKNNDGLRLLLWTFAVFFGLFFIGLWVEAATGWHSPIKFFYA